LKEDEIISQHFTIYYQERGRDYIRFYVIPKTDVKSDEVSEIMAKLAEIYDVKLYTRFGEYVIELKERKNNYFWNLILLFLTFISTTFAGAMLGERFDIIQGVQFSIALLFVLGSHEMGHYFISRKFGMKTSLPYFIPFPTIIGTMGAIIKHKGAIPDRKALLAVGISGPLAGILASIFVVIIGLQFEINVSQPEKAIMIGIPPLFQFLMNLVGYKGNAIHPVAFAGWVGMFITSLNLIPVGQLDGGHAMRAMIGERAEIISKIMPLLLISIGMIFKPYSSVWFFWGLFTFFFSLQKHPKPLKDESLPPNWKILGIITFGIGMLCFTPTPFILPKNF